MITSVAFTVYPVADLQRARLFYENTLGLTPASNFNDEWQEYELGDSTFAITTIDMGHTPGANGAAIAFETSDLDSFAGRLKEQGVTFVTDIFSSEVCRMAVIQDPDGNHLVIHKRNS